MLFQVEGATIAGWVETFALSSQQIFPIFILTSCVHVRKCGVTRNSYGVAEELWRRARVAAIQRGETFKEFLTQAIEKELKSGKEVEHGESGECRSAVDGPADVGNTEAPMPPQADPVRTGEVVREVRKAAAVKPTCAHGIERGYHCWLCGGLAVIR
jgi:hypothetical protein